MWDAGYARKQRGGANHLKLRFSAQTSTVSPSCPPCWPPPAHSHRLQSCPRDRTAAVESGCRLSVSTVQCTQRALSCAGWSHFPQTLRLTDLKYTKKNTAGYSFGGGLKRYRPRRPFVSIVQTQKLIICIICVTCWRKNKLRCDYST